MTRSTAQPKQGLQAARLSLAKPRLMTLNISHVLASKGTKIQNMQTLTLLGMAYYQKYLTIVQLVLTIIFTGA